MPTSFVLLYIVFAFVTLLLLFFVLLRKGEGGGLSGAFAGIGGETAFGVKAAKQVDKIITWLAAIFLLLAVLLSIPAVRPGGDIPASSSGEESDG